MGAQRAISTDVYRHQKQVGGSEPREPVKAQLPKKALKARGGALSTILHREKQVLPLPQASPERVLHPLNTSVQDKKKAILESYEGVSTSIGRRLPDKGQEATRA